MGVLDEAIRQHLELKRQRGADPGEVKREEDEALGAAVRSRRAAPTDQAVADPPSETEPAALDASETTERESSAQPTEAFDPAEVAAALGQIPAETIGEQDEIAPELEQELKNEQQPVAEPQHETEAEPDSPEPDEGPSQAVAEEPEAQESAAEENEEVDELEDTPEFLEDAPEHDKLWFEQKPPKDFDF